MFGYTSRKIAAIEHHLHQNELSFELFVRPGCYTKSPAKALETLIEETRIQFWILQGTNLEMQLWFQENHIPAIITGTRFDGIDLPYADVDNSAICRHAVGLLLAKKRKSICYLKSRNMLPGDIRSEHGFMKGINAHKTARGKIARCKDTPEGITNKLDAILESKNKPDAFIMDHPSQAFCIASYLLKKGFRVPEDISLICRTESHDFPFMQPSIAHYARNTHELATRTAELAIKLARGEPVEAKGILIIPDFVPGRSL
jgi:LacI family transcriptional regulator